MAMAETDEKVLRGPHSGRASSRLRVPPLRDVTHDPELAAAEHVASIFTQRGSFSADGCRARPMPSHQGPVSLEAPALVHRGAHQ
jgi:hypothetical protein